MGIPSSKGCKFNKRKRKKLTLMNHEQEPSIRTHIEQEDEFFEFLDHDDTIKILLIFIYSHQSKNQVTPPDQRALFQNTNFESCETATTRDDDQ